VIVVRCVEWRDADDIFMSPSFASGKSMRYSLAHQARGLPIEAELIALEGMLFSDQILHGDNLQQVQWQLKMGYRQLPC
jgi:hypothetical protein